MLPIEPDNFKDDGTDLDPEVIDRIIEMAWEDRTPFEAIEMQYGLKENQVRAIMRKHMKRSSFHMWRKRVKGRSTKLLESSSIKRLDTNNPVPRKNISSSIITCNSILVHRFALTFCAINKAIGNKVIEGRAERVACDTLIAASS